MTRRRPCSALIDQSALNREIGGSKVMRGQLSHLAAMSRRPNITVQIIPNTGAHPGLLGAFTFADLGGLPLSSTSRTLQTAG